jgi:hypothetical protein
MWAGVAGVRFPAEKMIFLFITTSKAAHIQLVLENKAAGA